MPQFRHLARRILLSAVLPLAVACSLKEGTPVAADASKARSMPAMIAAPRVAGMPAAPAKLSNLAAPAQLDEAPLRRYVAIRHELNILTEAQAVESAWQQANEACVARRKALAQQTDRVYVTLNFQARPSVLETGIWVPVREAIVGAGRLFAESVAKIIALLVFVLPWILVSVPAGLLGRFAWLRFRRGS